MVALVTYFKLKDRVGPQFQDVAMVLDEIFRRNVLIK